MIVKCHYLDWLTNEKAVDIFMRSQFGAPQTTYEKDCYYTHDYELPVDEDASSFLQDVFYELNKDDRINGREERSMCVGDIIEWRNKKYIVSPIGFTKLI